MTVDRHAVVIPTYNERENITLLIDSIVALGLDLEIWVVDDNSPDGTGALVTTIAAEQPQVHLIHRPAKLGLGTAHIAGMKAALAAGNEAIVTMDADFSHDPRYLPDMLAGLARFDVVIGSRYVRGGGTRYCTLPRKALSRGANLIARAALGLAAGDATAGFRAYRRAVLESIPLDDVVSNGYSFLIEMLYRCQQQGWTIGEVPITFENRQRGTSKISRAEIWRAMQTVFRLSREQLGAPRNGRPTESQPEGTQRVPAGPNKRR